jgi:ribonuclease VapC
VIVVDSSALVEIILDAPFADACMTALEEAETVLMSAGTLAECLIVATGRDAKRPLLALVEQFGLDIIPVTRERAIAAARAYERYGKGWHAAALNFGDSFAYALAKEMDCPLLFVGNDFALTDVPRAIG